MQEESIVTVGEKRNFESVERRGFADRVPLFDLAIKLLAIPTRESPDATAFPRI